MKVSLIIFKGFKLSIVVSEHEETIRDSIYDSVEKSTRLKEMAEKKFGK